MRSESPAGPGEVLQTPVCSYKASVAPRDLRFAPATGDKETRAKPISAQAEACNVKVVRGPWNDLFLRESEAFPAGRFDDGVDALSGARELLRSVSSGGGAALARPTDADRDLPRSFDHMTRRTTCDRREALAKHFPKRRHIGIFRDVVDRKVEVERCAAAAIQDGSFPERVCVANFVIHIWPFPRTGRRTRTPNTQSAGGLNQ
jgi:hypothetical protein